MLYIWSFLSSFMMVAALPTVFMTIKLMPSSYRYFGNVFAYVAGFCLLFVPLFYGSVGTLNGWQFAPLIYGYAWIPFVLSFVIFYIADRKIKAKAKEWQSHIKEES